MQRFPDRKGRHAVTFENWPEFCRQQVVEDGYRDLKISMTNYEPTDYVSIIERVREAVGPDVKIHVDPHGTWNFQEAHRIMRGSELSKLTAIDTSKRDIFGFSVAISGNTAIVGAKWDDDSGSQSGSAYLFDVSVLR